MLAKCANPACNAPFLYLRDGKLFQIEVEAKESLDGVAVPVKESSSAPERKPLRRLEFFWLCGRCAQRLTLVLDPVRGVAVRSRTQQAVAS